MMQTKISCKCWQNVRPNVESIVPHDQQLFSQPDPVNNSSKSVTFLLIMIPIRPTSFGKRKLIRSTWYSGYKDSKDVMLRFIVGTKGTPANLLNQLKVENLLYNDIVFIDLREDPSVLTNKTLALMKWASGNVNFAYLMKCDDDTFVYDACLTLATNFISLCHC